MLAELLAGARSVLEIGSGTGQHAAHFAARLPHLQWQPTDLAAAHAGLRAWIDEAGLVNLHSPIELDVRTGPWPTRRYEAVFTANTLHILHWSAVERLFAGAGEVLEDGGLLIVYGPFSYGGVHTSASNARFDAALRARDPGAGVRDFDRLDALARGAGMRFWRDFPMPVNNRTLAWRRRARTSAGAA